MARDYQFHYSAKTPSVFDRQNRQRKAKTTLSVLQENLDEKTQGMTVLVVGASSGIIDAFLSEYFAYVVGMDIDQAAISYASNNCKKDNLSFIIGDLMTLSIPNNCFDVIVCSHVYEHVPDARQMMSEIWRVLRPGGICYFAAGNRLAINEPHYNLPFLSIVPRPLAHLYLRLTGLGNHYYEKHLSYWSLKRLVKRFQLNDYTCDMIADPCRYHIDYMLQPNSKRHRRAKWVCRYFKWLLPTYIWLLKKPVT